MTPERVAYLREHDPDYFERTGQMGAEALQRKHPDLNAHFSRLGKFSQIKQHIKKGRFDGLCSICEGPCTQFDDRIECPACGWKIYTFSGT